MQLERVKKLRIPPYCHGTDAIVDGSGLYIGHPHTITYALEPHDYGIRWEFSSKNFVPKCMYDGVLVVATIPRRNREGEIDKGSLLGLARGLDPLTGDTHWVGTCYSGMCRPFRGALLAPEDDGRTYSLLDPRTGVVLDTFSLPKATYCIHGRMAFLGCGGITAFDLLRHQVAWEYRSSDLELPNSDVAILYRSPNALIIERYCNSHPTTLTSLSLDAGQVFWKRSLPNLCSNFTLILGCLLALTHSGQLLCVDAVTGNTLWLRDIPSYHTGLAPPYGPHPYPPETSFKGAIVCVDKDHRIRLLDPQNGAVLADYQGPRFPYAMVPGDEVLLVLHGCGIDIFADTEKPRGV